MEKTSLRRRHVVMKKLHKLPHPPKPTKSTKSTVRPKPTNKFQKKYQDNQDYQDIIVQTKTFKTEPRHVWIQMIGKGTVTLELVEAKMVELQRILDRIRTKPCLQFTFVFDFRTLDNFADYESLKRFSKFMDRNKSLFESRLRLSYLLLRKWLWRTAVKTLLFFSPNVKEIEYTIPKEIDRKLGNKNP